MPYTIIDHRHRLAVWAAARATSRGIGGLKAARASQWAQELNLVGYVADWRALPEPDQFDEAHRGWRERLIAFEVDAGRQLQDGGVAKFINCYLKVGVVVVHAEATDLNPARRAKIGAIHPPIDRILRNAVAAYTNGQASIYPANTAWSRLDSDTYEQAIGRIRQVLLALDPPTTELWRIEELWDPAVVPA